MKIHASLIRCSDEKSSPLVEIMLTPWGAVDTHKGAFIVDEISGMNVLADFAMQKKDIPIDYEHTSVGGPYATADGRAPAAGWITKILVKPGEGIFGLVKWNDDAKEMIQKDEYRYLSPVLLLSEDRKVMAVVSAALTNTPAIIDMQRVAAKNDGERRMNIKALKEALATVGVSLAAEADDAAVLSAAVVHLTKKVEPSPDSAALASVRGKLGVDKDAGVDVIIAKMDEVRATTVPASEYTAVKNRLEQLELAAKNREGQELIATAIETAKLNPNHEPSMAYAREQAKTDPVGFKKWMEAAPALYTAGRVVKPDGKLDGTPDDPKDRKTVIATAKEEYSSAPKSFKNLTEEKDFVNDALRGKGLALLGKDE